MSNYIIKGKIPKWVHDLWNYPVDSKQHKKAKGELNE